MGVRQFSGVNCCPSCGTIYCCDDTATIVCCSPNTGRRFSVLQHEFSESWHVSLGRDFESEKIRAANETPGLETTNEGGPVGHTAGLASFSDRRGGTALASGCVGGLRYAEHIFVVGRQRASAIASIPGSLAAETS